MSESIEYWSTVSQCRVCGDPVGTGRTSCLRCGTPQDLLSASAAQYYFQRIWRLIVSFGELLFKLALIGGGLYICFTVSPFLTLLPLILALTNDPSS